MNGMRLEGALQSRLVHPVFARSHKSKAMLSFTHSSDSYDGADRENRGDHDIVLNGYTNCVGGSPQARMKRNSGGLVAPNRSGRRRARAVRTGTVSDTARSVTWERAGSSPVPRELTQGHSPRKNLGGGSAWSRRGGEQPDHAGMGEALRGLAAEHVAQRQSRSRRSPSTSLTSSVMRSGCHSTPLLAQGQGEWTCHPRRTCGSRHRRPCYI